MDLIKTLKGVKNLNDYISITQELNQKYKNAKISLNMATVLSVKNIRSLEIEYFNKCHDSGAAFNVFERLLNLPPSKTWSLLGKELISMIQYWLDAVRKHLILHHPYWWSFFKMLLKFIKELLKKEHTLNNILVEELSDGLLDVATRGHTDVLQRHEILHTFNQFCAESGRKIRLALRVEFEHYFIRLSTMMASCGHMPTQYSTLETLLRWLVPRHDPCLRQVVASKWFLDHLYSKGVRQIFLERPWMNFFQDARDMLNAHNQSGSHVTSVVCRKLLVGEKAVISGTEKSLTWLDLNCGSGTLSILLDSKALDAINATDHSACEAILISNDNTRAAKLYKESVEVILSITTLEPPKLSPSCVDVLDSCDITAMVSGRSDISGMDAALRTIFQDKYQVLMNVEDETTLSPEKIVKNHEEGARFSHPAKPVGRRARSGYMAWSQNAASLKSPSTASTTSLAQLHDKLAALPRCQLGKGPVSVCAQPKLSRLTELSETHDKQSFDSTKSTIKKRNFGLCHRSHFNKSQSDNEANKSRKFTKSRETNEKQVDDVPTEKRKSKSDSEEVPKTKKNTETEEESRNACLLLGATIGSDESVINDTLDRLSTNKDYSSQKIVDLLEQEALQAKAANVDGDKCLDSGINTGDDGKKTQDIGVTITDVQNSTLLHKENKDKYVSTDDSNTEAINDTPMCYVSVRKKKPQRKISVDTNLPIISEATYEVQAVEDFFSQHFCETKRGDLMISPTLARKINETSSESSEFGGCLLREEEININQYEISDIDIIECLNHIVDKVCHDFDKYLEQDKGNIVVPEDITKVVKDKSPLKDIYNIEDHSKDKLDIKDSKQTKKRGSKLKYNVNIVNKKVKSSKKKPKSKNKLELEPAEMSSVNNKVYVEALLSASPKKKNTLPRNKDHETPLPRRKRKLYSPKDDNTITSATEYTEVDINFCLDKIDEEHQKSDSHDVSIPGSKKRNRVTPKTIATSYKDIEKDRKRNRKTQSKRAEPHLTISPKTRKLNEVFDHLKENINSDEKITLANKTEFDKDMAIFNFTSDSDDEDFKKKKVDIQKKISTTTIQSGNSVISRKRTRTKTGYKEKEKSSSDETTKLSGRRKVKRLNSKTKTPKIVVVDKPTDLVDEKMRATTPATENALESSVLVDKIKPDVIIEPEPAIHIPEFELLTDDDIISKNSCEAFEVNTRSKKFQRAAKKEKVNKTATLEVVKEKDDDGTLSPLPGLLVEKVTPQPNYEDSLTSNFVKKVKKMYKTGVDLRANDTNTTQNLLSDNEKTNNSLQMNTTKEFNDIQNNVEDNAGFNDEALNEIGLKKIYSKISPVKKVEINNKNEQYVSDNKSVSSSKSKCKKRKLRLKSSDTANQSDSNTKYNLGSFKMTAKMISSRDIVGPSKQNLQNINLQTDTVCIDDKTQNNSASQISEKSIATDGITAHGDSLEEPPTQESLEQTVLPREVVDMDESVIDYYVNLRKEIDSSRYNSLNETIAGIKENKVKAKYKVSSPVLSMRRMTSEEIRNWTSPTSKKVGDYDYRRWLPSHKDSDSDQRECSEKSLSVSVTRLSPKVIDEWINKSKSNQSSDESRLSNANNLNKSPILEKSCSKRYENIDNFKKRKSIISPIKLWDDTEFKRQYPSKIVEEKPLNKTSSEKVTRSEKASTPKAKRYLLRKFDIDVSSPGSDCSTSTRIQDSRIQKSPVKRSHPQNENEDVKRRKVDRNVVLTESGPSVSSVEDWLMQMDRNKAGHLDASISDTMQNIMERLDTTVSEIHQNTSKKFVHLFVEAQRQLGAMKAEQCEMRRQIGSSILTRVAQVIEEEFSDFNRRSQKLEEKFMDNLKQQSIEFIKEERKQKQNMILVLREDVKTTLELVKKTNK